MVVWPVPENMEITVTLFRDPRTNEFEDKDWLFYIEDVSTLCNVRLDICVHVYLVCSYYLIHDKQ